MKGGAWIWILIALFMVFRLLLLASKKKKEEEESLKPTQPRPRPRPEPPPMRPEGGGDELKSFIDMLSGKFGQRLPPGVYPPEVQAPQPEEIEPPPRHIRKPAAVKKPPPARKPVPSPPHIVPVPPPPAGPRHRIPLAFADNPVVQGIILSEILGPPRGLQGRGRLPSDSSTQRR